MRVTWNSECRPWLAASENETRPVLQSVWVDPAGFLVATDCLLLAVVPCKFEHKPDDFAGCRIPLEFWEEMETIGFVERGELEIDGQQAIAKTIYGERACAIEPKAGFVKWRKVLPNARGGQTVTPIYAVDPGLLTRLRDAIGEHDRHPEGQYCNPLCFFGPNEPVVMLGASGAFGLAMPQRYSTTYEAELYIALGMARNGDTP